MPIWSTHQSPHLILRETHGSGQANIAIHVAVIALILASAEVAFAQIMTFLAPANQQWDRGFSN